MPFELPDTGCRNERLATAARLHIAAQPGALRLFRMGFAMPSVVPGKSVEEWLRNFEALDHHGHEEPRRPALNPIVLELLGAHLGAQRLLSLSGIEIDQLQGLHPAAKPGCGTRSSYEAGR